MLSITRGGYISTHCLVKVFWVWSCIYSFVDKSKFWKELNLIWLKLCLQIYSFLPFCKFSLIFILFPSRMLSITRGGCILARCRVKVFWLWSRVYSRVDKSKFWKELNLIDFCYVWWTIGVTLLEQINSYLRQQCDNNVSWSLWPSPQCHCAQISKFPMNISLECFATIMGFCLICKWELL